MKRERIRAYYLRLSLEDGDVVTGNANESCSIAHQRLSVLEFLKRHPELGEDFQEFSDDGYSGTNMDRPGIQKLLNLVKQGCVETIVVRDVSRFARNYLEAGHYLEYIFPAYGIRFISINDHYDSLKYGENPAGLDMVIKNLINEMYSRDISKKIRSAVEIKKLKGEYVYGAVPFGYKKGEKKNTIVIDEPAAAVVRMIFMLAIKGKTITEIAKYCNEKEMETPSQYLSAYRSEKYKICKMWTWDVVRNILENRIYTGDTEPYKSHVKKIGSNQVKVIPRELRDIVPETHEGIVTRDEYYRAQEVIKSHKKSKWVSQNNPLTSKLICGCCGATLGKGKSENKWWFCSNKRYNNGLGCENVRIKEEVVKETLLRAIHSQCMLVEQNLKELREMSNVGAGERTQLENEKNRIIRKKELNEKSRFELLDAVMEGKITREQYLVKKGSFQDENAALTSQLVDVEAKLKKVMAAMADGDILDQKKSDIEKYDGITELSKEVMDHLIRRVVIYPGKQIEIEWNFQDNYI